MNRKRWWSYDRWIGEKREAYVMGICVGGVTFLLTWAMMQ